MMDIQSLLIGWVAGLVMGGLAIYLLPYQSLRRQRGQLQTDLAETQNHNNDLQANLLEEQSTAYQNRQSALQQQKRLEGQLTTAGERHTELEKRLADLEAQREQEQQSFLREATRLRGAVVRLEQEQVALQDRYARDSAQWDRAHQSQSLQDTQIEEQFRALRQDKAALEVRLEQQHEAWERERLALQIQMNSMEDNLALQKARFGSGGSVLAPDSALLVEQLRAEASADLTRWQVAWDEERHTLRSQVERLQAERQSLREQVANPTSLDSVNHVGPSAQELADLRQQLEQAQRDRQALEGKLAAHNQHAEQERGALEAEIEQLMERLLRLQRDHKG